MKIEVRELQQEDRDGFIELMKSRPELAGGDKAERRTEVVWHMAFENPQADGNPTYFVAVSEGRILAHLGRMPTMFYCGGELEAASYVHDLYVHPEVRERGGGFFTSMRLYRKAEAASPSFCTFIWTNEVNIGLQQARKYEQLWVHGLVKPLAVDKQIESRVPVAPVAAAGKQLARLGLRAIDRGLALASSAGRHRIERLERFDERVDSLAQRVGPVMGTAPAKTAAYLTWKYSRWPDLDWAAFGLFDTRGQLFGLVVIVFADGVTDTGTLAELVVDPKDSASIRRLVLAATRFCRTRGATRVACMATDEDLLTTLRQLLFFPRQREPLFLAKVDAGARPDSLRKLSAWHLSYGDSEGAL